MTSDEPLFLDIEDVIEIHTTQLEVYGGSAGLRDRGLLESAVAQPQTSFGGEFVHDGLFAMAASASSGSRSRSSPSTTPASATTKASTIG